MNTTQTSKTLATNLVLRLLLDELSKNPTTASLIPKVKQIALQVLAGEEFEQTDPENQLLGLIHHEVGQLFSIATIQRLDR